MFNLLNLSYLSKLNGVGGEISRGAENFIVEEIDTDGNLYKIDEKVEPRWKEEEDYCVAVLQKERLTTQNAVDEISKALRISRKRISYAGSKDMRVKSTQLISIYKLDPKEISKIKLKNIKFLGSWYWDKRIKLGSLLGNKFKIRVDGEDEKSKIYDIYNDLMGFIPNYFGEQRFGTRGNNHIIGKYIVRGEIKNAITELLTEYKNVKDEEERDARKQLFLTGDLKNAIKSFPKRLRNEIVIMQHLITHKNDYVGSLRKIPINISLLFVHSYQSYLFNKILSYKIKESKKGKLEIGDGEYFCGENWYGFPDINRINGKHLVGELIGYETKLNEFEKEVLNEDGIRGEDFKIKPIPELSLPGSYRPYLVPLKNFKYRNLEFEFELPSGSYATVALREFLDKKKV